jgi:hypothetical protein
MQKEYPTDEISSKTVPEKKAFEQKSKHTEKHDRLLQNTGSSTMFSRMVRISRPINGTHRDGY